MAPKGLWLLCWWGGVGPAALTRHWWEWKTAHFWGEEFGNIKINTYFSLQYSSSTLGIHLSDTLIKTMKIHVYTSLLVVPIFVIKKKMKTKCLPYGNKWNSIMLLFLWRKYTHITRERYTEYIMYSLKKKGRWRQICTVFYFLLKIQISSISISSIICLCVLKWELFQIEVYT